MNIKCLVVIVSLLYTVALKSSENTIIEASFCGDATTLTNILSDVNQPYVTKGMLKNISMNALQALQLGTLSRGYNIIGRKINDDSSVSYDPLYQQVAQTLRIPGLEVSCTLKSGYNIIGRSSNQHLILLFDEPYERSVLDTKVEEGYQLDDTEYNTAHNALSLLMPNKSLLSSQAVSYEYPHIDALMKACRHGDSVVLKALLAQDEHLRRALQTNIENVTVGLNKAGTLRLNCLEAAMLGTLERGFNVIGLLFTPKQGVTIDTLFHSVLSTFDDHGIQLGVLKLHLQQ